MTNHFSMSRQVYQQMCYLYHTQRKESSKTVTLGQLFGKWCHFNKKGHYFGAPKCTILDTTYVWSQNVLVGYARSTSRWLVNRMQPDCLAKTSHPDYFSPECTFHLIDCIVGNSDTSYPVDCSLVYKEASHELATLEDHLMYHSVINIYMKASSQSRGMQCSHLYPWRSP